MTTAEYAKKIVDGAPPLTVNQRRRLATILAGDQN